jgi:hypothetical protein
MTMNTKVDVRLMLLALLSTLAPSQCLLGRSHPSSSSASPALGSLAAGTKAPQASKNLMASYLYTQEEYRQMACAGACTFPEFENAIAYRRELLCRRPELVGYFVEPKRMSRNMLTAFFLDNGSNVSLQFVFLGTGIGSGEGSNIKIGRSGCKIVGGRQTLGPNNYIDSDYDWSGARYIQIERRESGGIEYEEGAE